MRHDQPSAPYALVRGNFWSLWQVLGSNQRKLSRRHVIDHPIAGKRNPKVPLKSVFPELHADHRRGSRSRRRWIYGADVSSAVSSRASARWINQAPASLKYVRSPKLPRKADETTNIFAILPRIIMARLNDTYSTYNHNNQLPEFTLHILTHCRLLLLDGAGDGRLCLYRSHVPGRDTDQFS
jgi:hypothetical protein